MYTHTPRKLLISCIFFGLGHSRTAFSFSGSAVIPSDDTIYLKCHTPLTRVDTSPELEL
jgi:hypothetical protein